MIKTINQQRDYNVNQMSLLLEIPFSEKQIEKNDICFTVLNIVERIDLGKYIEFSKGRPTSYDIEKMFTAILLAFTEHGYAELRKIETLIKYDLRYRWIMQQKTPSYRTIGRFITDYLKMSIEQIHHDILLAIKDRKEFEKAVLYIDGTKFEANANKMTFFWRGWIKKYLPRNWKKVMELIRQLNKYFRENDIDIKYSVLREPSIDYMIKLDERLNQWLDEIGAVKKGKGIHPVAQIKRELNKCAKKIWEYALAQDILGDRNSFSKTDPDATLMHMKYDYYNHTNVFKPGYNVQIGVVDGYIALYYVSPDANDMKTYIPLMEEYKDRFRTYPVRAVADAGYGSLENYNYSKMHGIHAALKYSGYETKKEKVTDKNRFRLVHMKRTKDGTPICPAGNEFTLEDVKVAITSNGTKITNHYRNKHCENCPMRSKCTTAKEGRTATITPALEHYHNEVDEYFSTEEGKRDLNIRSSQTEGKFGDIKKNYEFNIMKRRGEDNARLEIGLVAIGHNIRHYHNELLRNQQKTGELSTIQH